MKIIITGPKGSGKSTLGKRIAEYTGIPFVETDELIEDIYFIETGMRASCREIYNTEGADYFRTVEQQAVARAAEKDWCLVSTGGGSMLHGPSRAILAADSLVVLLKADENVLWKRITAKGIPSFLEGADGQQKNAERNLQLYECVTAIADIIYTTDCADIDQDCNEVIERLSAVFMLRMHSPNTFGEIIRTTTFGESHGAAVGAVLDGLAPGLQISEKDIQKELDRRRPGQSSVTTQRKESDTVRILSGVFEGKTTGTPLCMAVFNNDQDSSKYDNLRDLFRPGHADFTFWKKYGVRDHRGGGRSSGRETVGRVACGAVAIKLLAQQGIAITAWAHEIHGIAGETVDFSFIEKNPVRSADPARAALMEQEILNARKENDSVGGIARLVIKNVPPGLGDPVFFKLDARLAMAFFSLGAVKGVEVGAGFAAARLRGSENNDSMNSGGFVSNNAGGILGGISTGEDIILTAAVKPTPSISLTQHTRTTDGTETDVLIEGRHDPCIVPRIIPVMEAMAALVILDALEIQKKLSGNKVLL